MIICDFANQSTIQTSLSFFSIFSIYTTSIKECEEEQELVVEEKIEVEEKIKRAGRGKKKAKK